MNSSLLPNIWRFLLLWALQILILRPIALSGGSWLAAFIYPIFILFLPVTMPTALVVLLGFAMGISIDIFYDSPGVHAGASVFTAWFRSFLLAVFEPRGGFAGNQIPSKSTVTTQVPVPEHPLPLQPVNVEPAADAVVRVTDVPKS